ncbi:hypothetical protein [Sinorhizobium psoraleae]|uniref:Uncharacterized protein n=1 Tax=Sinorhizobium psoraleae TaxID=520838 RepID=A0ABT4KJ29_9HYPH|nr:hypothetical protein [Sinorhizobium psoraleae]MCZ4091953.1 hypothetical protein [Sinorhizobium psoraleae]
MTIVRRPAPSPRFFFSALFAVAGFAEERPAAEKPRRQMLLESLKELKQKARPRGVSDRNDFDDRLLHTASHAQ